MANTTVVGTASNTTTVGTVQTHPGQQAISDLLQQYRDNHSLDGQDSNYYLPGLVALNKAMNMIILKNDPWAYQILWQFYLDNIDGVCQEQIAMKGIDVYRPNSDRMVWLNGLFRGMTTGNTIVTDPTPYIQRVKDVNIVLWVLAKTPSTP